MIGQMVVVEAVGGIGVPLARIQIGGDDAAVAEGAEDGHAVLHQTEDGGVLAAGARLAGDASRSGLGVVMILSSDGVGGGMESAAADVTWIRALATDFNYLKPSPLRPG